MYMNPKRELEDYALLVLLLRLRYGMVYAAWSMRWIHGLSNREGK